VKDVTVGTVVVLNSPLGSVCGKTMSVGSILTIIGMEARGRTQFITAIVENEIISFVCINVGYLFEVDDVICSFPEQL